MTPFQVPDGPYTIEQVMEEIRRQVVEPAEDRTGESSAVPPSGTAAGRTGDAANVSAKLESLRETLALLARIQSNPPVYRIHSHRALVGRLIDPIKRLIHWGARPYADVARERQDEWNAAASQAIRQALNHVTAELQRLNEALTRRVEGVDDRVRAIENRSRFGDFMEAIPREKRLAALDRSRGDYDDIHMRQKVYVDYFRDLPGQMLDIGCGRGELLNMLRGEGIECWGIDTDPLMVEMTRSLGVHAVVNDAMSEMRTVKDGKLGGMFAAQVVEHMFPGDLLALLRETRRALAPGGVIVLETLNPASLGVLAKSYYRDIDHKQPIHPETLAQLLEQAGFAGVELHYLNPFREDERPPALPGAAALGVTAEAHAALQRRFEMLDGLIYGMQDYYVVARQPAPGDRGAEPVRA
jgi:O-antigen chain-terminating methyltransferase